MPTLHWIGKEKVVNHHQEVPYRVLEHKYGFRDGVQSDEDTGSGNMIIHGDNLEALKSLLPKYQGKINCIYIDPPYNTGNEKWVYNDNVNEPHIKKWLGAVVGTEGEDLSRHDKWLCMMYPRLALLHKLLSDNGVILISIDDNEQANLKLLLDDIFGSNNYIGAIIWQKRKGGGNDSFFVGTDHEYVLSYVKDNNKQEQKWRVPYDEDYLKRYKFSDEKGRYYYDTLSRPGLNNPIIYDVVCPDGSVIKDGTWQISEQTFKEGLATGEVAFIKNREGGYSVVRKVRVPTEGKVFRSIITNVSNKDAADEMEDLFGQKKAFSTPKPTKLINDLISLVSDKNAIILDSFAGSGTTAHSVLNLNKDGGNRKFILVEMEEYAEDITAERVRRVIQGYGEGKNAVEGTGGAFDFYELGEPLFREDGTLNEEVGEDKIREYIFFSDTQQPLQERTPDNKYYLGNAFETAYYFYYEQDAMTILNHETLRQIVTKRAEQYIIYADICTLTEDEMNRLGVVFKKIPRDIKRF